MFSRIHHVGLVTDDLERTREIFLEKIGCAPSRVQEVNSARAHTVFLRLGGVEIEIMQPKGQGSVHWKALERNGGPCISHFAFAVPDTAAAGRALEERGVRFLDGFGPGTYSGRGYEVLFLDPAETDGIVVQVASDTPARPPTAQVS